MSDADLRRARRDGPAAYARQLVRAGRWRELSTPDLLEQGLVDRGRIDLARQVIDSDWANWETRCGLIRQAADLLGPALPARRLGPTLPARLGADYAARLPQGPEGRRSIVAALAWSDEPTEERRLEANAAAEAAAGAAAYAAAHAAAAAADLAHEWEWQRWRLARYLVAPDWPTPVEME